MAHDFAQTFAQTFAWLTNKQNRSINQSSDIIDLATNDVHTREIARPNFIVMQISTTVVS